MDKFSATYNRFESDETARPAGISAARRGEEAELEYQIIGLKGTRRWMDSRAVPLHDKPTGKALVLSITRDASVLPNPRGSDVLRVDDVLLCFGSYATLRALLPRRSPEP